ncbi:hypothetical protein Hsar01_01990 [Haloferula sargassicola]|uniref:Uncharacterized protein n=1 Tax=Haloferula sargassicola TaxID=490096 RepID=A0ABP9UQ02_9BACT
MPGTVSGLRLYFTDRWTAQFASARFPESDTRENDQRTKSPTTLGMQPTSHKSGTSPKNPRPVASPFSTEASLVDSIASAIGHDSGIEIVREFDSLHGIADLVLFRASKAWESRLSLASVPSQWAFLLRSLPYRRAMSFDYFWGATHASKATAKRLARCFCSAGYLEQNSKTRTFTKIRQPQPLISEIVAIEAKLTKWRDALQQARRYQHFAHKSWVVLDATRARPAIQNLELFERSGIGLATCDENGSMIHHISAKRILPKTDLLYWRANVELSRKLVS